MELRKHSEILGPSRTVRKRRVNFFEKLALQAELDKDLKVATEGSHHQVADAPSSLVQKRLQERESHSQRMEQSSGKSHFLKTLKITPSQFEEIKLISQMQEKKASSDQSDDHRVYQRTSDIAAAVGIARPQIEKLLYEGKIEVLSDKGAVNHSNIQKDGEKLKIFISQKLSFEKAIIKFIQCVDHSSEFRDLFQGEVKPLRQKTSDIDVLYRDAELARQELHHFIKEFAAQTCARNTLLPACLKDKGRLHDKAKSELDGDVSRITDIARGAIVYPTMKDLKLARARMESELRRISPEAKIVRIIDRFVRPTLTGYRDIWCDIQMSNGHIAELQLRLAAIDDVADEQHKLYEEVRSIRVDIAREGRTTFNKQERQKFLALNKQSRKLFEGALNNSRNDGAPELLDRHHSSS